MKLASLRRGGRDGTLIVVSRDLARAVTVPDIAPTLQAVLDEWAQTAPRLATVAQALDDSQARSINGMDVFAFDPEALAAPLPKNM